MDSDESPLDVLSRAATMVSPPSYDEARSYSSKELPSTKWRKDRQMMRQNDGPLDFSTHSTTNYPSASGFRAPPSYDQTIRNKCNSSRPSVIQSTATPSTIIRQPSPPSSVAPPSPPLEDVCDPAIDEHFRRSLGKDYSSIFSPVKIVQNNPSDSDLTGLSVDDHFAKALGDTWIKLKEKESKEKGKPNADVNGKKQKNKDSSAVITSKRRAVVVTST